MAIDPLRTHGGRILQLRDRPAGARNGATPQDTGAAPGARALSGLAEAESLRGEDPAEGARAAAPGELNVRKALVLSRIQKDYYSQAHVRERVIESLLQFLDEE